MDHEPDIVEKIYETATASLHVSGFIHVKEWLNKWKGVLSQEELLLTKSDTLPFNSVCKGTTIPQDILEELFLVTNPVDSLYPEGMMPFKTVKVDSVPADNKLQTVKHATKDVTLKKHDLKYYQNSFQHRTYNYQNDEFLAHKYAVIQAERKKRKKDPGVEDKLSYPEAIITFNYYRPQSYYRPIYELGFRGYPVICLQLLSSNSLAELRDAIKCPKDFEVPGDFSLAPNDVSKVATAKELLPSGLFFIEDTFYVDSRSLKAQDYSKQIVDWLRKKGCTEEFPVKSMTRTKLVDLKLRLGMPYVYIHQGSCEHVMQFTDIRLITPEDTQTRSVYPIQISSCFPKLAICNACQTRAVRWMVVNSTLSPSDPAHYCDVCFKMMHYESSGNKTSEFQAFQYTDNAFFASM